MRKALLLLVVFALAVTTIPAQTLSVADLQEAFETFADEAAAALPMNALVGLNWSDAYIGKLLAVPPNLGAGVTFGATSIPYEAVKPVLAALGAEGNFAADPNLSFIVDNGMPIPALVAEARVGGVVLPFDAGIKFASVPKKAVPLLPDKVGLDYLSFGADFRYALLKGGALLPKLSVGASYNFLRGAVSVDGITGGDITLQSFTAPDLADPTTTEDYSVILTDPAVAFEWTTNVIEAKAQVSKKLLFLTPYAGLGLSSGFSNVSGGLTSELSVQDSGGTPLSDADVDKLIAVLPESGPTLEDTGFYVEGGSPKALAMRLYGGLSINLLVVYLDLTGMYNLIGGNWGASLGARIQL